MSRVAETRVLAGRYRLARLLGRGGFSEVWQAEDSVLGRVVAVKVFAASAGQADVVARFHREARILAGLRHPNVVVVFDAGVDHDVPYVVMELLAGPSLHELLAMRGPLRVELALGYAEQAAAGLAAAHDAGVVHRDIKPGNLVLDSDGTLKVVDFGIASLASASMALTASGSRWAPRRTCLRSRPRSARQLAELRNGLRHSRRVDHVTRKDGEACTAPKCRDWSDLGFR